MYEEIYVAGSGVTGKVSILVPTYNIPSSAKKCIESLRHNTDYPDFEICIADDANPSHELKEYLRSLESVENIKVVFGDKRLEYGGNIMRAFNISDGQIICVFNDDAHVPTSSRDWLSKLVRELQMNPKYGSVTPKVLYDSLGVYWVGKKRENANNLTHDFLHLNHDHPDIPKEPVECCYNNFACCVMWRELVNKVPIGSINNHYGSDSAWCHLVEVRFGLHHYMVPVTYVHHANLFNKRN